MNSFKRSILFSALALLGGAAAWAQISSSTGAIQGTVTDPQNAAVASAKVNLTNLDTGAVVSGVTQADGGFVFPLLAPGNYRIQVESPGFESMVLDNVKVEITKVTNANARLRLGQVTTVTEVSTIFQTVDTRTATTGDVITGNQVRNIPLPTRNFLDLTALQAGTSARMQSAATVGRGAPTLDVAGSRGTANISCWTASMQTLSAATV